MNSPSFSTIFPRGEFVENRWNFHFPRTPYRRGNGKLFHLVEETGIRRRYWSARFESCPTSPWIRCRAKSWPKNVLSFGHCLRRLAPALRRARIAYERDKGTRRIIHLCKARDKTSESSEPSEKRAGKDVQDVSDNLSPHLQE
jgi:hypothetical protein